MNALQRRGPFMDVRVEMGLALAWALVGIVWAAVGGLPGGRWGAVHFFTLGVLTNAVEGFSRHFAATLQHQPVPLVPARVVVLNGGAVVLVAGMASGTRWAVAVGGAALMAGVLWLWWSLRVARRAAPERRFAFVVRTYQRATGAFLHGALLGVLMGTGVVVGGWYASTRLAHMHVMALGWGGLPLLATLLTMGPTVVRRPIAAGAEAAARRWLPHATTSVTVATLLLFLSGVEGTTGTILRVVAAVGLLPYLVATAAVVGPFLAVGRRGTKSAVGLGLGAAGAWAVLLVTLDVVVLATGAWRWLAPLGALVLFAVLGQAISSVFLHALSTAHVLAPAEGWSAYAAAVATNTGLLLVAIGMASAIPIPEVGWALVVAGTLASLRRNQ